MSVNRSQPRYRALAAVLQKDLLAGKFPVGSVLPGELELVARHRVSRHTVREALRCLEEQGLITRKRGIGTVVTALESLPGNVQRLASPAEWMRYPEGSRLVVLATDEIVADGELASSLACKRGTHWCRVRALRRLKGRGGVVIGWSDIYLPKEYAAVAISVGKAGGYVYEAIEKRFGTRVETVEVELRAEVPVPRGGLRRRDRRIFPGGQRQPHVVGAVAVAVGAADRLVQRAGPLVLDRFVA